MTVGGIRVRPLKCKRANSKAVTKVNKDAWLVLMNSKLKFFLHIPQNNWLPFLDPPVFYINGG